MLELICDKNCSLKEFTENRYAQASFFWRRLLQNKDIKVNGRKIGADVALRAGDTVCYYLTPKQAEKPAYHTVYEDGNVLVIDKESGVNSEAVFAGLSRANANCRFIHRLDRNTRGLMAFALNDGAEAALLRAFKARSVEKIYHALCFGRLPKSADILEAYLKKDEKNALVRIYDRPTVGAEKIVTEYAVIEENAETSKVRVVLHTGKTHQIRAHLAHIGNPIVGDMKYGDGARNKAKNAQRQCLVAKTLRFSLDGELSYLNGKTFESRFEAETE